MLYVVPAALRQYSKTVSSSVTLYSNDIVLNGIVDYLEAGMRDRWCFNGYLERVETCSKTYSMSGTTSSLTHPRSTERLLLRQENVDFLIDNGFITTTQGAGLILDRISDTISLSSSNATPPIYSISGADATNPINPPPIAQLN